RARVEAARPVSPSRSRAAWERTTRTALPGWSSPHSRIRSSSRTTSPTRWACAATASDRPRTLCSRRCAIGKHCSCWTTASIWSTRARVLDPQQIAARLDDVFGLLTSGSRTALPHHRTLRSTIEWSHGLLTEQEQILFRRLAVFAGGFTIDAAEAVAEGGAISAREVLDLLSGLVDKSLILLETEALEARYRMLETIRQFARERLEEAGEAAERGRRHAQFFLARAEAAAPFLANQSERWQEGLAEDPGNVRCAADGFEGDRDGVEENVRFAAALHWF